MTSTPQLLHVDVGDDGPGIEPAARAKIFERLYTTRDVPGRTVGTGLGLAIVGEIAAAMGGTCTLADRPGPGAEFRLTVRTGNNEG